MTIIDGIAIVVMQSHADAGLLLQGLSSIIRHRGGSGGVAHAAEHGDRNDDGDYSFNKAPLGFCLLYSRMPHLLPPLTHRVHVHDSHLHHQSRIQPTRIHFRCSNHEQ